MNRNIFISIGKSNKITRLMIHKLKHTTISPFTRSLNPTAGTLTTGNFNELRNVTETTIRRMFNTGKAFTRTLEMIYLIARHLEQLFAVFFT
nr:hypothetical protein WGDTHNWE_WGDTHNWE_CDS_0007 [Microvirus sp.]